MTAALRAARNGWSQLPLLLQQVLRFGTVSATALIVDVTAYATLVPVLKPAALAAFVAYSIGGLWHYLVSSVIMFRHEMPTLRSRAQWLRFMRYFGSTLAGLAVTTCVVGLLVDLLGQPPWFGKLCAIPLSFLTVFSLVRMAVFFRAGSHGTR
jgi:putative flippase GtrA